MKPKTGEVWLAEPPIRFEKKLGVLPEADLLKIKRALIHACKLYIDK
jgi:hypothetical protein